MAIAQPAQGALSQMKPPPASAPNAAKFDAGAVQAENIEEITKAKPTGLKETIIDDLGDQREAMNAALMRLREGLDARKNRPFDPVLMQTAAGFLKPTKTGSFGESLGYAAEGAGAAAEREMLRNAETQKLEQELLGKEIEFRQQLGGDQLISQLMGGAKPSTAPAPAGGAVTTPSGGLRIPNTASPVDVATAPRPEQVLTAARQGRIPITDEVLLLASRVAPKMLPTLTEIRKAQEGEEKNRIENAKLEATTRKVKPHGGLTEREMDKKEYAQYLEQLADFRKTGDEQKLLEYYFSKGWLEDNQSRRMTPATAGSAPAQIPRSKSQTEIDAEKETATQTAKERATSAEQKASKLSLQAEAAFANMNTADDMIGYAKNNPKILAAMNKPGIFGAVARAAEQGVKVGDFSVSLPAKTLLEANLTGEDLAALQIFAQKYAELQSRGRQLNRTPGEGAISDYETKLLGSIYALPTDSQRAVILKSDALKLQSMFDEERFKLWNQKSKQTGYSYNDFMVDDDYKSLKTDYKKTLDRVREENLDLLTPKKKTPAASAPSTPAPSAPPRPAPAPAAPPKPATAPAPAPAPVTPSPVPANEPPKNETYSQRLERLRKEREAKGKTNG